MTRHLPNALTLCNLLCGLLGVRLALTAGPQGLEWAAWLVLAGAFFDLVDGGVARALGVSSEIGKQLDSLSDLVTFGALPCFMLWGLAGDSPWGYASLAVPTGAALRLARFNVEQGRTELFHGLPTPACGLAVASLPFLAEDLGAAGAALWLSPEALASGSLALAALMVSRLPLLALKIKSRKFAGNRARIALAVVSVTGAALFQWKAVPFLLAFYVALSLGHYRYHASRKP